MNRTIQLASRDHCERDSEIAGNPRNQVICLPQPTSPPLSVQTGQTVQWSWDYNFSATMTGVFESVTITAAEQPDGSYLTPALLIGGSSGTAVNCVYTPLDDPRLDPPPAPPPPNVIIVDNSSRP